MNEHVFTYTDSINRTRNEHADVVLAYYTVLRKIYEYLLNVPNRANTVLP